MEKKIKRKKRPTELCLFLIDTIISFAVVMVLIHFVIRPIQVKGRSMYPTLEDGSFGFSNTIGYHMSGLKRVDVVILYLPEKKEYLVKRIIALPGEKIAYKNSQLYINDQPVVESFLNTKYRYQYGPNFTLGVKEMIVPQDTYYCLGDNRPNSSDSRVYGPFKKSQIVSKGVFICFPFSDFGVKTW